MNEENQCNKDWLPFPTNKRKYTHTIGKLREEIVRQVIKETILEYSLFPTLYNVPNHDVNDRGADVTVQLICNGKIIATILKLEITNWRFGSYIDYKEARSIYNNLLNCPFKGLICTVLHIKENDIETQELVSRIPVLELLFQEVTEHYYRWFKKTKNPVLLDGLRYSSKKTYAINKFLIKRFLEEIGFIQYIKHLEANILSGEIRNDTKFTK